MLDVVEQKYAWYHWYNDKLKGIFYTIFFISIILIESVTAPKQGFDGGLHILFGWFVVISTPILFSLIYYINYALQLKQLKTLLLF